MQPCRPRSSRRAKTGSASGNKTASDKTTGIADNFQTFLTLLTTQLQNQNPLDPLDTNQFTQQLVQFAGVEQQFKQNEQMKELIALEKSEQSTQALIYVGNTVAVDGSSAVRRLGDLEYSSAKHHRQGHDHQSAGQRPIAATSDGPGQLQLHLGRQGQ